MSSEHPLMIGSKANNSMFHTSSLETVPVRSSFSENQSSSQMTDSRIRYPNRLGQQRNPSAYRGIHNQYQPSIVSRSYVNHDCGSSQRQLSSVSGATGRFTASGGKILGETSTEVDKKVQTVVIVEEHRMVPETRLVEKVIDETRRVRQRTVQIEKPVIVEKVIEVPEIEYETVMVPQVEVIYQDNVIEVPKIEYRDRIVHVPKIVYQNKVIEVPTPEYREVEIESIIEVPQTIIETKIKEVVVPQYVEVNVPEVVDVEVEEDVDFFLPVPLAKTTELNLKFPALQPRCQKLDISVYVPRFIEVAVPVDLMDDLTLLQAQEVSECLAKLQEQGPMSLQAMEVMVRQVLSCQWDHEQDRTGDNSPWVDNWAKAQIPVDFHKITEMAEDFKLHVNEL